MHYDQNGGLTDAELHALFDRLPHGFAGADVLAEVAPDGWEQSPLLACFHPSVERVFEDRVLVHRNLEKLRSMRRSKDGAVEDTPRPEPSAWAFLDEYLRGYRNSGARAIACGSTWGQSSSGNVLI